MTVTFSAAAGPGSHNIRAVDSRNDGAQGHFFSAGFDPVEFTRLRHEQILSLHLKDRKKNQGATVPFREGDTPVTELLQLIRDNRYGIAGFIEHEYEAKDPVEEVRKGVEYCKRALLGATRVQG